MYKKVIVLNINIEMVSFIKFTAHTNAHEKALSCFWQPKIKLTFVSVSTLKNFTKTQLMKFFSFFKVGIQVVGVKEKFHCVFRYVYNARVQSSCFQIWYLAKLNFPTLWTHVTCFKLLWVSCTVQQLDGDENHQLLCLEKWAEGFFQRVGHST